VAACIASSAGWADTGFMMPMPIRIRLVAPVAAATSTGAERQNRSCETQT
jgi:hypothetical protein